MFAMMLINARYDLYGKIKKKDSGCTKYLQFYLNLLQLVEQGHLLLENDRIRFVEIKQIGSRL